MLARVEIGRAGIEDPMAIDDEFCTRIAETYQAPAATARRGIPTESLNPMSGFSVADIALAD
jgi:hypothetical protein